MKTITLLILMTILTTTTALAAVDHRPPENFHQFKTPFVLLQEGVFAMAYQEGTLWGMVDQTGQLVYSSNQGESWGLAHTFPDIIQGIYFDQVGNMFVSTSQNRWGATPTGAIHRSTNGGASFTTVLSGMSGAAVHWNFASLDGTMFVSEYGFKWHGDNARRIYRSLDFGQTWAVVFDPGPIYNYHHHRIIIAEAGVVYQAVGDGGNAQIIRSTNNGNTWEVVATRYQPTSAIVFDTHILWGLDGGPYYGVMRYCRSTGAISRSLTVPAPFASSNYDMLYANGIVYAMFLSYGGYVHPASIFYSRNAGETWHLLGYIDKAPGWGVGLLSIVACPRYAYVAITTPIYHGGQMENNFYGTLRFRLLPPHQKAVTAKVHFTNTKDLHPAQAQKLWEKL